MFLCKHVFRCYVAIIVGSFSLNETNIYKQVAYTAKPNPF